MNTTARPTTSTSLTALRALAGLTAALSIAQALLGITVLVTDADIVGVHGIIGMTTAAAAILAAGAAALWYRTSHNGGLLGHAIGVAVLAVAQVGLGEMGLESVHVAVGVLVLAAAIALATLSTRKPLG